LDARRRRDYRQACSTCLNGPQSGTRDARLAQIAPNGSGRERNGADSQTETACRGRRRSHAQAGHACPCRLRYWGRCGATECTLATGHAHSAPSSSIGRQTRLSICWERGRWSEACRRSTAARRRQTNSPGSEARIPVLIGLWSGTARIRLGDRPSGPGEQQECASKSLSHSSRPRGASTKTRSIPIINGSV
jgi:hypothetical protein